jgi:UDP-N-acetyl-D-mannosaminuronate dehydrogenase
MLERRGAKVNLYDPLLSKSRVSEGSRILKRSMKETVEGADCIVLLTSHDQFKRLNLKRLITVMKMPATMVDLIGLFEPHKVERKGLKYRGFGRRVENK